MWTGSIIYHIKIGNNLSGQQQDLIGFSVAFGNLAMEQYLQCEKMLRIDEVEKSMLKKYVQFDSNFLKTIYYMYIYIHIYVYASVFIWKQML